MAPRAPNGGQRKSTFSDYRSTREGPFLSFIKTIKYIHHEMAPSKPRNAVSMDSVVSLLALESHFAISDNHPSDKSVIDLGKLMLVHVQWQGNTHCFCQEI